MRVLLQVAPKASVAAEGKEDSEPLAIDQRDAAGVTALAAAASGRRLVGLNLGHSGT